MGCSEVREALSAALDEEEMAIHPAVAARHLQRCAGCRRYSDDIVVLAMLVAEKRQADEQHRARPQLVAVPDNGPWRRVVLPAVRWAAAAVPVALAAPVLALGGLAHTPPRPLRDEGHCAAHLHVRGAQGLDGRSPGTSLPS